MNTEIKDFPKGVDEKGLLYLIWKTLTGLSAASAKGGQSDWEESDSSDVAYIKNKPEIPDVSGFVAPLVVEGTVSSDAFTPGAEQATLAQAIAKFTAGGVVLLSWVDGEADVVEAVVGLDDGVLSTKSVSWE